MESYSKEGLRCRILYADFTQFQSLQVRGAFSKLLAMEPGKDFQMNQARAVKTIPFSGICGSILVRSGQASLEHFHSEVADSLGYKRTLFVPIGVPPDYARILKSAAARALGPSCDVNERSGVEFTTRTVGGGRGGKPSPSPSPTRDASDDVGLAISEDENLDDALDADPVPEGLAVEHMTEKQLKQSFGRGTLAILGALFQHQSKIGTQARFLEEKDKIFALTESGRKKLLRKGQLHPTVVHYQPSQCREFSRQRSEIGGALKVPGNTMRRLVLGGVWVANMCAVAANELFNTVCMQ